MLEDRNDMSSKYWNPELRRFLDLPEPPLIVGGRG
jgi:hypothetical protein